MTKRICVVTGSRADYGLLFWLMKGVEADPAFELQIVATGMHLSPDFGLTYRAIEEDGFRIDEKVEMLLSGDTASATAKSIGMGVIGFSDVISRLRPDVMVLVGDRFEIAQIGVGAHTHHAVAAFHLHKCERTTLRRERRVAHSGAASEPVQATTV